MKSGYCTNKKGCSSLSIQQVQQPPTKNKEEVTHSSNICLWYSQANKKKLDVPSHQSSQISHKILDAGAPTQKCTWTYALCSAVCISHKILDLCLALYDKLDAKQRHKQAFKPIRSRNNLFSSLYLNKHQSSQKQTKSTTSNAV